MNVEQNRRNGNKETKIYKKYIIYHNWGHNNDMKDINWM